MFFMTEANMKEWKTRVSVTITKKRNRHIFALYSNLTFSLSRAILVHNLARICKLKCCGLAEDFLKDTSAMLQQSVLQ